MGASRGSTDETLYDKIDLDTSMARIEVIDFKQIVLINGIIVKAMREVAL